MKRQDRHVPPAKLQALLANAVALHRAGRLADAENLYRQARVAAPKHFDVLHLSGVIAYQQGRAEAAIDLLARAHRIDRTSAVCVMRLGLALLLGGRPAEAEAHLRAAVKIQPDFFEGWDNLAYALKVQDRLAEAIECHQRATKLSPSSATVWYNFGLTLSLHGQVADALACHERALAAEPGYALARFGRAQALHQANRIGEAVADYEKFLALQPGHHEARSYRLFALQSLDAISRAALFAEHVEFGRRVGHFPAPALPNSPDPNRRLRLAILSPDLRAHSCAYFLEPLLRQLDPTAFELYLYHDHFRQDATSARLQTLAAVWRNFVGQSAGAVENAIRADAPDVLIDLAGHTGMTNRLPLFARRLAPVQITYLGYPDTTGLPAMDYRFTDETVDPPGDSDRFATERLVRFSPTAWTYQAPENAPPLTAPPCSGNQPFTFGCFNNLAKITDEAIGAWARVLEAVPHARLLLKGAGLSGEAHAGFADRFRRRGVPRERVEFLERTPDTTSHLALYGRIDVALDSFPYHGTTTTCEALWMGVPVVTLAGDRHVSRVGASLLSAIGRQEWIAPSVEDYTKIAIGLANARDELGEIRHGLRARVAESALGQHRLQASRFEVAVRACWRQWCEKSAAAA